MKKSREVCFILLSVLLGSLPVSAHCGSQWDEFLRHPDKDKLVTLEETIKTSAQRCSSGVAPVQKHRTQLFKFISRGNPSAFHAALLVFRCWDGGELEDFYRSAGIFFELQPHFFLRRVKEGKIEDSQLRDLLTMLPLDSVDNIDYQISVVENRITILRSIADESFREIRTKGVNFLEKEKEDLNRIKIEDMDQYK